MNTNTTHKTTVACTEDDIKILDSLIDKRRIKNRSEALVTIFDEYRHTHPAQKDNSSLIVTTHKLPEKHNGM
jgi:metal-responsive CopG/Arc/MetJ family transcriptional regulator